MEGVNGVEKEKARKKKKDAGQLGRRIKVA